SVSLRRSSSSSSGPTGTNTENISGSAPSKAAGGRHREEVQSAAALIDPPEPVERIRTGAVEIEDPHLELVHEQAVHPLGTASVVSCGAPLMLEQHYWSVGTQRRAGSLEHEVLGAFD